MNMMTYANEVADRITEVSGIRTEVNSVLKNNDTEEIQIIVGERISGQATPSIKINPYYEDDIDIEEAARSIIECYNNTSIPEINFDEVLVLEEAKEKIFPMLINKTLNSNLIAKNNLVTRDYLEDLAIVYKISLPMSDGSSGLITVNHAIIGMWHIGEDELHEIAMENLNAKAFKTRNIAEMLMDQEVIEALHMECPPMYVTTSDDGSNGSNVLLRKDILAKLEEIHGGNFIIIPSSIHEIISLPMNDETDEEWLKGSVTEVNQTQLLPNEVLSSHPYYFINKELVSSLAA